MRFCLKIFVYFLPPVIGIMEPLDSKHTPKSRPKTASTAAISTQNSTPNKSAADQQPA
ncbi:hypothetical protein BD289DRAFT_484010 [Coniella lustricola]|uniref:Uncharacterized protein n=1 Tax=Coniella lustricola TaxID=2025994 RepID=A0A2T3A3H0_9PEZI|nr:hypothetical protein BD289DRAFT_484010 [Coniella lustricola]